jgi:hypothetical protein
VVDAQVVAFLAQHTFSRTDFSIGRDGVCRLHPQLARVVAQIATLRSEEVETEVRQFASRVLPVDDTTELTARASTARAR